jgi:hypothetical protein
MGKNKRKNKKKETKSSDGAKVLAQRSLEKKSNSSAFSLLNSPIDASSSSHSKLRNAAKKKINVRVREENYIEFKKKLVDERISASAWFLKQITKFCADPKSMKRQFGVHKSYVDQCCLNIAGNDIYQTHRMFNMLLPSSLHARFKHILLKENINISDWIRLKVHFYINC